MSVYRNSLLAFASLLPIALAMPVQASTVEKDNVTPRPPILREKESITRVIQGKKISASGCQWYNFHQSISLWPTYVACEGKTSKEVLDYYHFDRDKVRSPMSAVSASGFSKNAAKLMEVNTTNQVDFFSGHHKSISLHIDGKQHESFLCSWFNYIESRHRTPLYVQCGGRSNKGSYGRYSAPDFLKNFVARIPAFSTPHEIALARIKAERDWEAKQTGPAPDVVKALNAAGSVTRQVGDASITLSRCEWSNFFQSLKFLPRFIECQTPTHQEQIANYVKNQNLKKIKSEPNVHEDSVARPNPLSRNHSEFAKIIKLKVAMADIEATACDWYNLVQTEMRWPIYRDCLIKAAKPGLKPQERPVADVLVHHRLPYSD